MAARRALTRLTITDAEDAVVEGAKQRIGANPRLRIAPFEDVVAKSAYDVVLAGDALARLDADQLGVASSALAAGGLFLAVEPAPDLLTDLRQGASADWWADTVTAEAPIGRRKPPEEWADVLREDRMEAISVATLNDPSVEASLISAIAPERMARAEDPEKDAKPIVILHDGGARSLAAAEDLEAAMAAVGRAVRVSSPDDVRHKDDEPWEAVYLAGLFADSAEDMERAQARIAVIHGLLAHAAPQRLWLVTRGGAPAGRGKRPDMSAPRASATARAWAMRSGGTSACSSGGRTSPVAGSSRRDRSCRARRKLSGTIPPASPECTPSGRTSTRSTPVRIPRRDVVLHRRS